MELKILGCHGPYPTNNTHALSGYLVSEGKTKLVMDFGSGVLARLFNEVDDLRELNGIFISHLHYDHTSDLLPLKYALENTDIIINIFTAQNNSNWYREIQNCPNFNIISILDDTMIKCGNFNLSFYSVKHSVPTYAIKVQGLRTLFYTADTIYFEDLEKYAEGSHIILADCVKPDNFKGMHMKYSDALKLSKNVKAKLIATHISGNYNDNPIFSAYLEVMIAEEGKTFEI